MVNNFNGEHKRGKNFYRAAKVFEVANAMRFKANCVV